MVSWICYPIFAMVNHPCHDCPSRASHGVIACPLAAAILNKGRCRRIQAMTPDAAGSAVARARAVRWDKAQESDDIAVVRFLRWQGASRDLRLANRLRSLTPDEQIALVASPVIVRAHSRANGDWRTVTDELRPTPRGARVPSWERDGDETAASGTSDAPRMRLTGNVTPVVVRRNGLSRRGTADAAALRGGGSNNGVAGEPRTGRGVSKRLPNRAPNAGNKPDRARRSSLRTLTSAA